jgi:hypothetical protein
VSLVIWILLYCSTEAPWVLALLLCPASTLAHCHRRSWYAEPGLIHRLLIISNVVLTFRGK